VNNTGFTVYCNTVILPNIEPRESQRTLEFDVFIPGALKYLYKLWLIVPVLSV